MDSLVRYRSVNNIVDSTTYTFEPAFCLMIHYMPTIESLDPRLQDIYKGMRPPGTPRYGLG
jgi:hypothetical protein